MKHNAQSSSLPAQALTDLHADIAEKHILLASLHASLPRHDPAADPIKAMLAFLNASRRSSDTEALRRIKREALVLYRTLLIETASRAVSPNWQSPSSAHAIHDEAGKESGKIILTMNDYKRDYHRDAMPYEQAFRKEYIDGLVTIGVHTYLVSSGMAGLTTILAYLQGEKFLTGSVIVGENTYFQGKGLILSSADSHTKIITETDTDAILTCINDKKPTVIFLDSLTNSATMTAPDLTTILIYLVKNVRHDMAIVIGNTALSIAWQPLHLILGQNRHLRLVVYESLIKFHAFGTDRVTGGIIWAYGPGTEKLFDYRKNCGTNISDLSAHALPYPNRELLERRLNRMNRNARFLADHLKNSADVCYTSGCLVAIRFGSAKQTIKKSRLIMKRVIAMAKKQQIPLVAGTSFGFDTTRLYLTASNTNYGEPFLRLAAGTEDRELLERIAAVIGQAIEK